MRLPHEAYPMLTTIETQLDHLTGAQQRGLVWWVYGTILAGSACERAVVTALEPLVTARGVEALRQRLRDWLRDGAEKAVPGRTDVAVHSCFAPLLRWVLSWWQGTTVPLALDATLLHDRLVVLTISVVYRGSAIPVAWHVTAANRKGAWLTPICALIATLAAAVPSTSTVVLLTDRGLWSPRIWQSACAHGWHPLMRIRQAATFHPTGGERVAATRLVPGPGHAWVGTGMAYKPSKRRAATLLVVWEVGFLEPCLVLTDLAPEAVGVWWYGLRAWIEAGFRVLTSFGWHWERTRRTAPHRVARHWLVLAVATLWTVAVGRCRPVGAGTRQSARRRRPTTPHALYAPHGQCLCPGIGPAARATAAWGAHVDAPVAVARPAPLAASDLARAHDPCAAVASRLIPTPLSRKAGVVVRLTEYSRQVAHNHRAVGTISLTTVWVVVLATDRLTVLAWRSGSSALRITSIETISCWADWKNWLFVKITTDSGLYGWGEASLAGAIRAVESSVHELGEVLIGQDPGGVERHWHAMYHTWRWRGGAIQNSAMAGLDIALWDLEGKRLGVPVYRLLGGPYRTKLRGYASHWLPKVETPEAAFEGAQEAVRRGFSAFKWNPFGRDTLREDEAGSIARAASLMEAARAGAGPDVEIYIDCGEYFSPRSAVLAARAFAPYRPGFFEEPIPFENAKAMNRLKQEMPIPLATGERLLSRWEYRELIEGGGCDIIQPDLTHAGGITEVKRIATLADTYYVSVAPHNSAGPIGTLAAMHLSAAIPNFLILEQMENERTARDAICTNPVRYADGHFELPTEPGLGTDLNLDAIRKSQPRALPIRHTSESLWH